MWLREHARVYSAGSPVDTGEIALYKNYSLLLLLRKELIQETLEARKGPRQIDKHRNKQIIMSMRKKSGEITSD